MAGSAEGAVEVGAAAVVTWPERSSAIDDNDVDVSSFCAFVLLDDAGDAITELTVDVVAAVAVATVAILLQPTLLLLW